MFAHVWHHTDNDGKRLPENVGLYETRESAEEAQAAMAQRYAALRKRGYKVKPPASRIETR